MALPFEEAMKVVAKRLGRTVYGNYMSGDAPWKGVCIQTAALALGAAYALPMESLYADLRSMVDQHFETLKKERR